MPLVSTFYGILIHMYWLDTKHHNLPHVHARYAEFEAIFAIETGDLLDGELPRASSVWFRRGSSCAGTNCWQTGRWPSGARKSSRSSR